MNDFPQPQQFTCPPPPPPCHERGLWLQSQIDSLTSGTASEPQSWAYPEILAAMGCLLMPQAPEFSYHNVGSW